MENKRHVVQVADGDFLMKDMFEFLDSLRESGQINMFGANVLVDVFGINKFEAREVLAAWMKSFEEKE